MAYSALVGARVKRKEDPRLITGVATYVGDIKLPGMQHVAFVRSPYAHARIGAIDLSQALEIPGVVAVVTGEELQPFYQQMPMSSAGEALVEEEETEHKEGRSHYAISIDRVRYVGEIVAAVIASSPDIAEDAAQAVMVDWEELPAVADTDAALEPDAPAIFEQQGSNVGFTWERKHGDVDGAFASAYRVVEQRIVSQRLSGVPMEGRAVLTATEHGTGGLTVWTSTQGPHAIRGDMAKVLGMNENQIRVIAPEVGGGFGVKIGIYSEEVALAAMTRHLGMPLRWVEARVEHMMATTHGRAQYADMSLAVSEDGTVNALRMQIVANLGAYPCAPDIPSLTGLMAVGVYGIPAVDIGVRAVFTNTTPVAAYRGAGRPEAAYYIERMMDLVAAELKLDPAEVRRRNFIPSDAFPYRTATGQQYDSGDYDLPLRRALEISGYEKLRAEQERRRAANDDTLMGIGIACYTEIAAFGFDSALVRVEPSGTVTVFTGISPHGQGQETSFAQIVADQLGADFESVEVRHGDTRETPMGQGTMGSRGLVMGGASLTMAVGKVREKARRIAAFKLEAAPEDITVENGRYGVQGVPGSGLSLSDIANAAYGDRLPDDMEPGLEATAFFRISGSTCPFGAHVAVVEIERDTGVVHLRDYYSVDDCGQRISPLLVEGQVHGGLAQGISQALWEEVVYDENGTLITGSFMDYTMPRASFFPHFTTDETVTPSPLNPLGIKGIGEAATIGSTPCVANAVLDALAPVGVRHLDVPLTPEKVWRAIGGN